MDVGDFYEGLQPQEYVEHDDTLGPAINISDEEAICYLQHQIFLDVAPNIFTSSRVGALDNIALSFVVNTGLTP